MGHLDVNWQWSRFLRDPSVAALVLANAITIGIAFAQHWQIGVLAWVYWAQSLIIGFFSTLKILSLREFSTEGFRINGEPVAPTAKTKHLTAFAFVVSYGIFHVIYLVFLLFLFSRDLATVWAGAISILAGVGSLFLNHLFSFFYHRSLQERSNIGRFAVFPFVRVIPMHLTILFAGVVSFLGGDIQASLIVFLVAKTAADVTMHVIEHADARGESDPSFA